jgi:hypothetical protein
MLIIADKVEEELYSPETDLDAYDGKHVCCKNRPWFIIMVSIVDVSLLVYL